VKRSCQCFMSQPGPNHWYRFDGAVLDYFRDEVWLAKKEKRHRPFDMRRATLILTTATCTFLSRHGRTFKGQVT